MTGLFLLCAPTGFCLEIPDDAQQISRHKILEINGIWTYEIVMTWQEGDRKVTSTRYVSDEGKPDTSREGYYEVRKEQSANGQGDSVKVLSYYDAEGKPFTIQKGYARSIERVNGHETTVEFFGADGKRVISPMIMGVAKYTVKRAPGTNEFVELRTFGVDGKPMNNVNGTAIEKAIRSSVKKGTRIAYEYYDSEERPVKMGVFPWTVDIENHQGVLVSKTVIDYEGHPMDITVSGFTFSTLLFREEVIILLNAKGDKVGETDVNPFWILLFGKDE